MPSQFAFTFLILFDFLRSSYKVKRQDKFLALHSVKDMGGILAPSALLLDRKTVSVPGRNLILLIHVNNKLLFLTPEGRSEGRSASLKNNVSCDCDCVVFLGTAPAGEAVTPPFPGSEH